MTGGHSLNLLYVNVTFGESFDLGRITLNWIGRMHAAEWSGLSWELPELEAVCRGGSRLWPDACCGGPFDDVRVGQAAAVQRIKAKRVGIKRALLDQALVSGIGNIYADEALWAAKVHGETPASSMTKSRIAAVIDAAREVMAAALAQGRTSFDSLYVDEAGSSGYFERSLHAYGREGEPCDRCGTPIVREKFMNRSSHFCPACQRKR